MSCPGVSTNINSDGSAIPHYRFIPCGYLEQFKNAEELLSFQSATTIDDLKEGLQLMKLWDVKPPDVTLCEKFETFGSFDEYLRDKGLNEAEQHMILLYVSKPSDFEERGL